MRILILAPHTDDGEFGCGGTIAKLIENRNEVHYIAFSSCELSVPDGFPKDVLIKEVTQATRILGIPGPNLQVLHFPVRSFDKFRQEILEEIVKLQRTLNPDLVFLPSMNDLHQDHQIIANEGIRAFKKTSVFAYEMPWNNISFSTQAFIHLEEKHLQKKMEALSMYKSQLHRPYASEAFVKGLAVTRGTAAGVQYAEAFEVVRLILNDAQ